MGHVRKLGGHKLQRTHELSLVKSNNLTFLLDFLKRTLRAIKKKILSVFNGSLETYTQYWMGPLLFPNFKKGCYENS